MNTIDVGPAKDQAEREAFARIIAQALEFPGEHDWLPRYHDTRIIVARVGDTIAGCCALSDMGQWFGGRSVPLVGVNGVGVLPEYRGKGVASALMRWVVEDTADRGTPLSGLYPATQPVYRRVGYDQAGSWTRYIIPLALMGGKDRELDVERCTLDDMEEIRRVYNDSCLREPGKLDRNRWAWQRILDPIKGVSYIYKVLRDGVAEGYVVYKHRTSADWHGFDLQVEEMVANTRSARQRIYSLLYDHRSMARKVYMTGSPALSELLRADEQGAEVDDTLRWMIRVANVQKALQARGYSKHVTARVVMQVDDDVLPDNAGIYSADLTAGSMTATRDDTLTPTMRIDVRGLAGLYTGHLSAEQLAATGLVDGDPSSLAAASALFAGPPPWLPEIY